MEYLRFFYNILIIASLSICVLGLYLVYRKNRQKYDLWFALLFLVLWINNFITFMVEFVASFRAFYMHNAVFLEAVLSVLAFTLMLCFRMSFGHLFGFPPKNGRRRLWIVAFLLLLAVSLVDTPACRLAVTFYIYPIDLFLFGLSLHRLFRLRLRAPTVEFYSFLLLLSCSALVLLMDLGQLVYGLISAQALIHERTLPSEILCAIYVIFAFIYLWSELVRGTSSGVHFVYQHDEALIARFASKQGLTAREHQVLLLLLEGRSNTEVSQQLFIAEGTVKVHAHNIYQKLGISQRVQLNRAVSEFAKMEKQPLP